MTKPLVPAKTFRSLAELTTVYREGHDFQVTCIPRPQRAVGIVAPHGGDIEAHTAEIAAQIAGTDFSLYTLKGIRASHNYEALHLTSHYFDDPRCVAMLASCDDVVAVHGCSDQRSAVFLGGLDQELSQELATIFDGTGIPCHLDGHDYPGKHPNNICNRGRSRKGVQLELSKVFRESDQVDRLVDAVRAVLLRRHS